MVLLVAVEKKPTMVHGGYCVGGQCFCSFFLLLPRAEAPASVFFPLPRLLLFVLLCFSSSPSFSLSSLLFFFCFPSLCSVLFLSSLVSRTIFS